MKDRLPALDGLRGFAALSVMLGHAAIWNFATQFPALQLILIALSAAHNAVQILFVLSGFLIAYLYPTVPSPVKFLKKRYGRIFPIYATIVLFIWLRSFIVSPFLQVAILIILALAIKFMWERLTSVAKNKPLGTILFYAFVSFQLLTLVLTIILFQKYAATQFSTISHFQKDLILMLTNLTFTSQFVKNIPQTSGVFWSLGVEVLFYILYPFIIFPVVRIARERGLLLSILIILASSKILLDLDNALTSVAAFNGLNIARANGFIAGVTIGTIYQSQGSVWKKIKPIVSRPLFGFLALALLILVQLGEHIVGLGSISFMNYFYLITSWLIAIVVLNCIIPHSLTYKIFSKRILMFIGLISYSLYLIHAEIEPWRAPISRFLQQFIRVTYLIDLLSLVFYVGLSIAISYFLFRTVEYLYFKNKKKVIATTQASISEKVEENPRWHSKFREPAGVLGAVIILSLIYSGMYSPKLLITRHMLPLTSLVSNDELSLKAGDFIIPFTAHEDYLSVISLDTRYAGSAGVTLSQPAPHAQLHFDLLDENKKVIFTSSRDAYLVEGSPRFQFGFPTIENSKDKKYFVKLSLTNAKPKDDVMISNSSQSFITLSKLPPGGIVRALPTLVINRLLFIFSSKDFIFVMVFIVLVIMAAKVRPQRITKSG